jgi:ribosomal protein S18 acetylase RimI-like enzyme
MDLIIKKLTKPVLAGNIDQFIDILKDVPGEYWDATHFLIDLPGKFQYSCYALTEADKLAGYIISSTPDPSSAHIHKFMIAGKLRGRKIGQRLLCFFEENVRKSNLSVITLKVLEDNMDAVRFYARHGFEVESKSIDTKNSVVLLKMIKLI